MTSLTNAEALICKAAPEGLLAAADDSIVRARRAIPINTVVLVAGGIGDHDPGATPGAEASGGIARSVDHRCW